MHQDNRALSQTINSRGGLHPVIGDLVSSVTAQG